MQEASENVADLVTYGIKCCNEKGAEYADVKYMHTLMENITFKNKTLDRLDRTDKKGIGIRCLVNKSWGFASSNELTRDKVTELAELAIKIAKASSLVKKFDIILADEPAYEDKVSTHVKKDPFLHEY